MHAMFRWRQRERKLDVFFCQKFPRCSPGGQTCHCICPRHFARPIWHRWFCKFWVVGQKPEFILAGNFVYVFLDKNRISQHKITTLDTHRLMGDLPNRYIVGHWCFWDVAYFIFDGWHRCSDTYFKDGGMKWSIYRTFQKCCFPLCQVQFFSGSGRKVNHLHESPVIRGSPN